MSFYEVSVEHSFPARHALPLPDGTAEAPHEHLWRVTAVFRCEKLDDAAGIVIDFLTVRKALKTITADLTGGDLNEAAGFSDKPPSAERVAELLAGRLMSQLPAASELLWRLAVTEAPGCSAAFYPGGFSGSW